MNNHHTEIVFILDRSGSMSPLKEAAVAGFNEFLNEQRTMEGQARITLVLFDNEYLVSMECVPLEQARELDSSTYIPRGSTALLDAIGTTIDRLGGRLASLPDNERPPKVIVAIFTDGQENSSTKFSWKDVSDRILERTNIHQWDFLFLGANQDSIATAANLHIPAAHAATWTSDSIGSKAAQKAMSLKLAALRKKASASPMTFKDQLVAEAPLAEIVFQEDSEGRGRER